MKKYAFIISVVAALLLVVGQVAYARINNPTAGSGGGSGVATSSLVATYPVVITPSASALTFSLAFGTTTANTWSQTQTFTSDAYFAGKVGIGTSSPETTLTIQSTATGDETPAFTIDGSGLSNGNGDMELEAGLSSTAEANIDFARQGTIEWQLGLQNGGGATGNDFELWDGSGNPVFTVNHTSLDTNIGTTTCGGESELCVWGDSGASTAIFQTITSASSTALIVTNTGKVGIGTTTPTGLFGVSGCTTNVPCGYFASAQGQNAEVWIGQAVQSMLKFKAQDNQFRITYPTKPIEFDSDDAGTATLWLDSSNRVGVGATTSVTATLGVQGTVMAKLTTFATGDSAVCQRGAGGFLTVDAGLSSCIVSSMYTKNIEGDDSFAAAWARIQKLQVVEFNYKDTKQEDIGLLAEAVAKIDPRYAQYTSVPRDVDGHHYDVGDPMAINWTAIQSDMIVVMQGQISGTIGAATRSAEENWQWGLMALLSLAWFAQQIQIRKLKKSH